jgi:D-tyrosyl-tRNA(Tyr) deacylase
MLPALPFSFIYNILPGAMFSFINLYGITIFTSIFHQNISIMRALIQRVNHASVTINEKEKAAIGKGLLILLGVEEEDTAEDIPWLTGKISKLRIFEDDNGQMNHSVLDVDGEVMVISQFTLHAKTRKGTRPSYSKAAGPDQARELYESFARQMGQEVGKQAQTGEFGAYMKVSLENDGPVTIMIDSKNKNL